MKVMKLSAIVFCGLWVFGSVAYAKPSFVRGAKCVACHEGMQANKKNVNAKSLEMMNKYKDKKCSECHGVDKSGTLTTRRRVTFYEAGSGQEEIWVDWFALLFKVIQLDS